MRPEKFLLNMVITLSLLLESLGEEGGAGRIGVGMIRPLHYDLLYKRYHRAGVDLGNTPSLQSGHIQVASHPPTIQ